MGVRLRAARTRDRGLEPDAIGAFRMPCGAAWRNAPGASRTSGSTPRSSSTAELDPDGALRRALRAAGWRPATPIQPNATRIIDLAPDEDALWGDLRKKWRQYVNKARNAGITVERRRGRRPARVLPDLPRDGGPGRLPHPDRAGLSRRLGGLPPDRQRPPAVRPAAGRRARRHAVPRPERDAGRRAVRRDDRGRRRVPGELPPEVGGDPDVARAGRHELRPVGPRHRRDRPLQDRASGVASSTTSARGTSSSTRSAGRPTSVPRRPASGWPGAATAWRPGRQRGRRSAEATPLDLDPRGDRPRSWPTGTSGRSTPRAATSTSRGRGPSTAVAAGWTADHLIFDDGYRCARAASADPASSADAAPMCRAGRSRPASPASARPGASRRSPTSWPAPASPSSRATPRFPPRPGYGERLAERRLPPDRGDPAVAPPDQPGRSPGATPDDVFGGHREVDPPADPQGREGRDRGRPPRRTRAARRRGRGVRRAGRADRDRPRPVLRAPARDGRAAPLQLRAARARSSPGGAPRLGPGTSSTSRRGRPTGPRRPGWSCTATASGCRPSTRATTPAARRDHPGALHLLRWRAIELALREGRAEMDLGGVDVAGARREPREGEPMWGLYQHKRSFGGEWLELTGAHERVLDASRYRLGRLAARRRSPARAPMTWRLDDDGDAMTTRPERPRSIADLLAAAEPADAASPRRADRPAHAPAAAARRPRRRAGDRAGGAGRRSRSAASPTIRGPSGPGSLFVAIAGLHVDGHDFVAAAAAAGAAAAIVERPLPDVALPQLVVERRAGRPRRRRGLVVRRPVAPARDRRDHRHGRQDHDRVPGRGRARGGGPVERADRHGRDPGRRDPRGERGAHDDPGRAAPPAHAAGDGRRGQRGRGRRDDVARPRRRSRPRDRLRHRDPDQPDPRAPRVPRDVGGATATPSCPCSSGSRSGATNPAKEVAAGPGRRPRSSTPTTRTPASFIGRRPGGRRARS